MSSYYKQSASERRDEQINNSRGQNWIQPKFPLDYGVYTKRTTPEMHLLQLHSRDTYSTPITPPDKQIQQSINTENILTRIHPYTSRTPSEQLMKYCAKTYNDNNFRHIPHQSRGNIRMHIETRMRNQVSVRK